MTTAGGSVPYDPRTGRLLPASEGHVAHGASPPAVPADAIEAFTARIAWALAESRETGYEHGFLAYAPNEPGVPLFAEPDSVGSSEDIRWHWQERQATVALSFHTHPGRGALCIPSGMDMIGALVRGDHLMYVLTLDGRLTGWRFRDPAGYPRAVEDAMRTLGDVRRLRRPLVDFLYHACDALRPQLLEAAYTARVHPTKDGTDCRLERVAADTAFFLEEERDRSLAPA